MKATRFFYVNRRKGEAFRKKFGKRAKSEKERTGEEEKLVP